MKKRRIAGVFLAVLAAVAPGAASRAQDIEVDITDIGCNVVIGGELTEDDLLAPNNVLGLQIPDDVRLDFFRFPGTGGDEVLITLLSDDFVPALALLDTNGDPDDILNAFYADLDIPQSGNQAQIRYPLDRTGPWGIVVANWPGIPGDPGSYTLDLDCSPPPPPIDPPTNLTATTRGTRHVELSWRDNSRNEDGFLIEQLTSTGWDTISSAPQNATQLLLANLAPSTTYTFRVRGSNLQADSPASNSATATTLGLGESGSCTPSASATCVGGGRFKIEVDWTDFEGGTGTGTTLVSPADDSALFWFFQPDNIEVVAKVIDGCAVNDRYWFFAAAATTVAYDIIVTDTTDGTRRLYGNVLGERSPAYEDIDAFAACL